MPGNPPGIGFWALVREDWETHGRRWTTPGFRALFVHRFGNWRMGIGSRVLRAPWALLHRWMTRRIVRSYGIELDASCPIGRRLSIDHQSGIVVSGHCAIGDDCRIRQGVTMGIKGAFGPTGAPVLRDRVDIGAGAVLIGAITIGDDAVIGANAVVVHDVPPGAIAVGVPAHIVLPDQDRSVP